MLRQTIVFVLGAGASRPYGFPTSAELSAKVCSRDPNIRLSSLFPEGDNSTPEDVDAFVRAFERSGQPSVDAFLERRMEFEETGRLAIAAHLCRLEKPDVLFDHQTQGNWYKALWAEMTSGVNSLDGLVGRARFVTFNYDRSLEYFLHTAAKNAFGVDDNTAFKFLQRTTVIHVYGALGAFHFNSSDHARSFRPDDTLRGISLAASGIRLIPEGRVVNMEGFQLARRMFEDADVICFLGFGFDRTNIERLGLEDVLRYLKQEGRPIPRIVLSTKGKTDQQVKLATDALCPSAAEVEFLNRGNLETLAEFGLVT